MADELVVHSVVQLVALWAVAMVLLTAVKLAVDLVAQWAFYLVVTKAVSSVTEKAATMEN